MGQKIIRYDEFMCWNNYKDKGEYNWKLIDNFLMTSLNENILNYAKLFIFYLQTSITSYLKHENILFCFGGEKKEKFLNMDDKNSL